MKVGFIVQRYGTEVGGGSEFLCRVMAERMQRHWDLEVLTTCAHDYRTWADAYEPGLSEVNSIRVRRFPVDFPRASGVFDRHCRAVFSPRNSPALEQKWMREQGPYSSAFHEFLQRRADDYDFFVFFTYLYGTTYYGLQQVAHKSLLVPTAHDEPPFHLGLFEETFLKPRGLLYLTPEEKQVVETRYGSRLPPSEVVGVGVDEAPATDPARFLAKHRQRLDAPYILYLGRVDESKGCGELFRSFARFRSEHPDQKLKLVLIGPMAMSVPAHPDVIPLGFVDVQEKWDALAGAELLVMSSPFESLSFVTLEAWQKGIPVLANWNCSVLEGQCRRSGAGVGYKNHEEFSDQLSKLLASKALRVELGSRGPDFVRTNYGWPVVEASYQRWAEIAKTTTQ